MRKFENIDNILHTDSGCGTELDYVEQTSWILFLKYLDDLEDFVNLKLFSYLKKFKAEEPNTIEYKIGSQKSLCRRIINLELRYCKLQEKLIRYIART